MQSTHMHKIQIHNVLCHITMKPKEEQTQRTFCLHPAWSDQKVQSPQNLQFNAFRVHVDDALEKATKLNRLLEKQQQESGVGLPGDTERYAGEIVAHLSRAHRFVHSALSRDAPELLREAHLERTKYASIGSVPFLATSKIVAVVPFGRERVLTEDDRCGSLLERRQGFL